MKVETKICQNCKKDFIIEPEDFNFYEKIKVPLPTFCADCAIREECPGEMKEIYTKEFVMRHKRI